MLCKHCGNIYSFRHTGYCEDCYQCLIAENTRLQLRIKELEEMLKHKPKHFNEQDLKEYEKWIFNPEHIPTLD